MMDYRRIGVASTFSPRFFAVLTEADCFARHVGAELEIIHAADEDEEKEKRFHEALGKLQRIGRVRWAEGANPSEAIISAAEEFGHGLVIAGALEKDDEDGYLYAGRVARALMAGCARDLLLMPHPVESPVPPRHIVFTIVAGEEDFPLAAAKTLRPERATLLAVDTPFSGALAASLGKEAFDPQDGIAALQEKLEADGVAVESRVVSSTTGFVLCEVVQGLDADLMVVHAPFEAGSRRFPVHLDWLAQIIPTRLLVTSG